MTVTFTLTGGSASTDAGPFNISGTTNGGASNGESIATGVTKEQLLTGHTITNILDTITGGTIASTGASCPSSTTTWSVTPNPTPTSTPIPPTPTAVVFYSYQIGIPGYAFSDIGLACNRINGSNGEIEDAKEEVFAATDVAADVTQFFTNTSLTNGYGGSGQYHAYYRTGGLADYTGQVSASGFVTNRTSCIN